MQMGISIRNTDEDIIVRRYGRGGVNEGERGVDLFMRIFVEEIIYRRRKKKCKQ